MGVHRYLLYASYLGTPFRGCQRQVTGVLPRIDDPLTVQGQIEMGLKLLKPATDPIAKVSSRTDAGVHAINSTFHVDINRYSDTLLEPQVITICLNRYFRKNDVPIRINKTFLVPSDFCCRGNAISRTYLYRLCVIKRKKLNSLPSTHFIPLEEWKRCYILWTDTFDEEQMKAASKLFVGCYDFKTFMAKSAKVPPNLVTRKEILKCDVEYGNLTLFGNLSWPTDIDVDSKENYRFYNIYVKGTGFLYKQVRRMVASLIGVAQGKITCKDIKLMLQVPSHQSWDNRVQTVPAYGLYLGQVEYPEQVRKTFRVSL